MRVKPKYLFAVAEMFHWIFNSLLLPFVRPLFSLSFSPSSPFSSVHHHQPIFFIHITRLEKSEFMWESLYVCIRCSKSFVHKHKYFEKSYLETKWLGNWSGRNANSIIKLNWLGSDSPLFFHFVILLLQIAPNWCCQNCSFCSQLVHFIAVHC